MTEQKLVVTPIQTMLYGMFDAEYGVLFQGDEPELAHALIERVVRVQCPEVYRTFSKPVLERKQCSAVNRAYIRARMRQFVPQLAAGDGKDEQEPALGRYEEYPLWIFAPELDRGRPEGVTPAPAARKGFGVIFLDRLDAIAEQGGRKAIKDIWRYNECERYVQLGEKFGRLMARLLAHQWGSRDFLATLTAFRRDLAELILMPEVNSSIVAHDALKSADILFVRHFVKEQEASAEFEDKQWHDLSEKQLSIASDFVLLRQEIAASIWVAVGEVLGFLREVDLTIREAQWAARTLETLGNGSPPTDNVQRAIHDAELQLGERRPQGDAISPESIVRILSPCIEALTKRMWSQSFSGQDQLFGTLAKVLNEKAKDGSQSERRFANAALTLYKQFRTQATHEMDEFKCNYEEAEYFLAGVKLLRQYVDAGPHS